MTGDGYTPGTTTMVRQCFGPRSIDCAFTGANSVVASVSAGGSFEVDLLVFRTATLEGEDHDCTTDPCTVQVTGQHDGQIDLPVSFVPTGTYQWPQATLSISPATGVRDGQAVAVVGDGYSRWPGFSPIVGGVAPTEVCRAVADPDPDDDCLSGLNFDEGPDFRLEYVPVDAAGHASGSVPVGRWLDLPSGEWDCAVGGCTIALSQGRNPVSNRVPLSFGPEWLPYASAGTFVDAVYGQMIGTNVDFHATYDGLTNAQVVDRAYLRILGRASDPPGRAYWLGRLDAGMTRDRMVHIMSAAPEHRVQQDSHARIEVMTFGLKGRAATAGEWASTPLQVARGLLADG